MSLEKSKLKQRHATAHLGEWTKSRSHQMLEGDFFYGGESLLQDMTARVLQRRKRTVTLMARPIYDAAAVLRAGSFGIGQINA